MMRQGPQHRAGRHRRRRLLQACAVAAMAAWPATGMAQHGDRHARPDLAENGGGVLSRLSPDLGYALRLMIIRGHLEAAQLLIDQGLLFDAVPHLLHPAEGLYEGLAPLLAQRGARPFDDALLAYVRGALNRATPTATRQLRAAVEAALLSAEEAIPAAVRTSPGFVAQLLGATLAVVVEEYGEAFEDGRLANVVEYQDAFGMLRVAARLLQDQQERLLPAGAEAVPVLRGILASLAAAFPDIEPPAVPRLSQQQVAALAAQADEVLRALR
jgi:hypothetical protein